MRIEDRRRTLPGEADRVKGARDEGIEGIEARSLSGFSSPDPGQVASVLL